MRFLVDSLRRRHLLGLALTLIPFLYLQVHAQPAESQPTFELTPGEETFEGKISELSYPKTITIES